jgi:hypothetical protein
MAKRMFRKAAGVGRAAVFTVGVATVLAMMLGVATTATAADGNSFILGKTNVAKKVSTVVKRGAGAALGLTVAEGQAPLTVNPEAGTATNLSADELDGKSAEQFLPASTYYEDSPETTGVDIGNGTGIRHASFACDPGDQLLTGGYRWMVNATSVSVVGSWPSGNSWIVQWANTAHPSQPYEMQIYVKCADTAAPTHT